MKSKPITGRHVLIMMVGFFAVVFGVNAIFITQAFRTFRGEDVPRSYMQGIAYNETLAARQAQAALGWTAIADVDAGSVRLMIFDAAETPVTGLALTGRMRHPADANRDLVLDFSETAPGEYSATHEAASGTWRLVAVASGEGPPFEIGHRIWLP